MKEKVYGDKSSNLAPESSQITHRILWPSRISVYIVWMVSIDGQHDKRVNGVRGLVGWGNHGAYHRPNGGME